jgi:predicted permease
MNFLSELWRRVQQRLHRAQWEDDLAEEMRLHLDLRAAEKAGDDTEAQAKRRFGNVSLLREQSREAWGWRLWDTLGQDVRYGLRTLVADPGFAAAAVLSLALGIGANTAIFSILNAVMLRSLPVEDPRQLVQLQVGKSPSFTNPIWEQVRDHQQAFSGTLAYGSNRFDLSDGGETHFAQGIFVSGDFFRVLGVPAVRGRMINRDDDLRGGGHSGPVAVISYAFWQANFGGDANILGKTVRLDRHPFVIVGVSPPWFKGLEVDQPFDVAIPIGCEPLLHTDLSALNQRSWWWLRIIGRLTPGETLSQAQARMNSIAHEIDRATIPPNWDSKMQQRYMKRSFTVTPYATGFSRTGSQYKTALFTLMAVVVLVLLIACANIANLLLARAAARQREIAVRLAIGAARVRVIRQLLTESLLLAFSGAIAGFLFSIWGSRLLVRFLSTASRQVQLDLSPDFHVFAFTAGVTILTGILFGLAPALRATSFGPNQVLKEQTRGTLTGATRFTLGKALVTGQVALSLMLLVGAGLFLGTFRNLLTIDAGFNRHNVLLVRAILPAAHVQKPLRIRLFDKILTSLRELHGVRSAASSDLTPIGHSFWNQNTRPEGYQAKPVEDDVLVYFNRVSPSYFGTLETPLLMGRDFTDRDNLAAPNVMIVSEFTARHFWGNADPIGKTIVTEGPDGDTSYQVIGLVKNAKYGDLNEPALKTAYVPWLQNADPRPQVSYELRTAGPVEALIPAVRAAIAAVSTDASLEFTSFETQVDDSLLQPRLVALLSSFFGFLALALAMVGLYGIISYAAAKRRGEIGIRMALGAGRRSVVWLVLRDLLLMLAIGTVLGVAASLAAGHLVTSLLFGVPPRDPLTTAVAALVLGAAATVAGYLPARRASRMDPMAALREE